MKLCKSCQENKEESCFTKDKRAKDGLYTNCRTCHYRKYQAGKPQKPRKYVYREEKARAYWKKWRVKNPKNKIDSNSTSTMSQMLRGIIKRSVLENHLGYSSQELKQHLEYLFTPEMSWENYGIYWSVDHIKPKYSFQYESVEDAEFKGCWSLKNLRPLKKEENLRKSNRSLHQENQ